jgi:hypothetical protein
LSSRRFAFSSRVKGGAAAPAPPVSSAGFTARFGRPLDLTLLLLPLSPPLSPPSPSAEDEPKSERTLSLKAPSSMTRGARRCRGCGA